MITLSHTTLFSLAYIALNLYAVNMPHLHLSHFENQNVVKLVDMSDKIDLSISPTSDA